jgi:hypothetical protein
MHPDDLRRLLEQVASGTMEISAAEKALSDAGVDNLGFARIDTDRERRTGLAEVVFASGKSDEQLTAIVERCLEAHGKVLATRVSPDRGHPLAERFPALTYNAIGRTLATPAPAPYRIRGSPWCAPAPPTCRWPKRPPRCSSTWVTRPIASPTWAWPASTGSTPCWIASARPGR